MAPWSIIEQLVSQCIDFSQGEASMQQLTHFFWIGQLTAGYGIEGATKIMFTLLTQYSL